MELPDGVVGVVVNVLLEPLPHRPAYGGYFLRQLPRRLDRVGEGLHELVARHRHDGPDAHLYLVQVPFGFP